MGFHVRNSDQVDAQKAVDTQKVVDAEKAEVPA